jgi:hypothetical protein
MKLRIMLAGTALVAAAAPAVWAQTAPVSGGTNIGGSVPTFLELVLNQPANAAFASFPKARTYELSFDALVTATDKPTLLTLADGSVPSGAKRGFLTSGSKRLPLALEARGPIGGFQALNQAVDPQLGRFGSEGTRMKATIKLRQKVKKKARGSYRKIVLVTVTSETP